jgi:hypothetical protein
MFDIHVSSKDNFCIRTYEHFPIKLRFLSKTDGKIIQEKVFYKPNIVELDSLCDIQILHLFSKNHFIIENSENVMFNEDIPTANHSVKRSDKSFSEISFLHENTDISMLARDDEISKIEENGDLKSLDRSITEDKRYQNDSDVRKNLKAEFDSINTDQNNTTPIKEKKNNKLMSAKKSSEKLTQSRKQRKDENETKPVESAIFPRKKIIIEDEETPIKNKFSTPIKTKQLDNKSAFIRKRKRDEDTSIVKCPICLESVKENSKLDICQHQFCKECIDHWSNLSNTCPVCKEEFKKIIYLQDDKTVEKSVKKRKFQYEEEEEESWLEDCAENCMVCGKNNDQHLLLVCDKCHHNICHVSCAGLELIPDEDWICSECFKKGRRKQRLSSPRINTRSKNKIGYSLRSKK